MIPDVELLYHSLKHYSPTGSTEKLGKYLVNWAKTHKMDAEVQNKMVVINPKAQMLLMLGHMDTVPGKLPVVIDEDSGVITGRGAADAKGPLCTALAALERLPQLWDKVSIIAAPDEEGPSEAAMYIRDSWQERPVVILEPSNWEGITISYMGRICVNLKIECPPSHSGHLKPFAAEELYMAWNELAKDGIARIKKIEGNATQATMVLDIRFREGMPEDILTKIPENVNFEVIERTMPYVANKNTKLTRSFLRAIRKVGGTPRFKNKTGTSDMNVLGEQWKSAPMLAYGPGDGNLGHTDQEHIRIEDYLKGIDVLERALKYIFQ